MNMFKNIVIATEFGASISLCVTLSISYQCALVFNNSKQLPCSDQELLNLCKNISDSSIFELTNACTIAGIIPGVVIGLSAGIITFTGLMAYDTVNWAIYD